MKKLIDRICETRPNSSFSVTHFGCGYATSLSALRHLNAAGMILVDANSDVVAQTARKIDPSRNERIVCATLGVSTAPASFYILNNAAESSLLLPGTIVSHMPNLRVVREDHVSPHTLDSFRQAYPLPPAQCNILVLEVGGMETSILESVPAATIQDYHFVIVRAATSSQFQGGADTTSIQHALERIGFTLCGCEDETTGPFRHMLFLIDKEKVLSSELELERTAHHAARIALDQFREELRASKEQMQSLIVDFEGERALAQRTKEEHLAGMSALSHECIELRSKLQSAAATNAELQRSKDEALRKVSELGERMALLEESIRTAQEEFRVHDQAKDDQITILKQHLAASGTKLAELSNNLKSSNEAFAELERQRQDLVSTLATTQRSCRELEETNHHSKRALDQLSAQYNESLRALTEVRGASETQRSSAMEAQELARTREQEVTNVRAELNVALEQLGSLAGSLEDERRLRIRADDEASALAERVASISLELESAIQVNESRDIQLNELMAELENARRELFSAKEKNCSLEIKTEELQHAWGQAREENDRLQAIIHAHSEKIESLTTTLQERDNHAAHLAERKESAEGSLELMLEEVSAARSTNNDLMRQLNERNSTVAELQSRLANFELRQSQIDREMLRAGAQIDLIKDVLLREAGL